MSTLPSQHEQIVQTHAGLIVNVVRAVQNPVHRPPVDEALRVSAQNGWTSLVNAIRQILNGSRDPNLVTGLDEEDSIIIEAILRGLQDPATLPDPNVKPDPVLAAPGLAAMIHASQRGDVQALQLLSEMAEQMTHVGGDMSHMGGVMRKLVDGERDSSVLSRGMSAQGKSLLMNVLEELAKLDVH